MISALAECVVSINKISPLYFSVSYTLLRILILPFILMIPRREKSVHPAIILTFQFLDDRKFLPRNFNRFDKHLNSGIQAEESESAAAFDLYYKSERVAFHFVDPRSDAHYISIVAVAIPYSQR